MKQSLVIFLFCVSLLTIGSKVHAQDSKIGIGAIVNSPTGLSVKAWVNDDFAIDGAFSFQVGKAFSNTYLHVDALQHQPAGNEALKFYYGLGSRFIWRDSTNDVTAGIRVPGGISYNINQTNIEGFFEIVPTLDINPLVTFGFQGAVGLRLYLN